MLAAAAAMGGCRWWGSEHRAARDLHRHCRHGRRRRRN
jgi:hypothetical protein